MAKRKRTRTRTNRAARNNTHAASISLPTGPIEPSTDLLEYNHCIFGRKGIGKTTLGSAFPNSLNFRFERGRKNVRIVQVPEDDKVLIWSTALQYLSLFCNSDYDFAVIDSVDKCYEAAFEAVCERRGCTHPNEKNDYGQTWNAISEEFIGFFDAIQDAGKRFVLLSHDKTRKYENPDGSELEQVDMTLAPSAATLVKERCDFVYYYGYAENDRVITIRNDRNQVCCACGFDEVFLDPDGTPLRRFEMPNNPNEAYDTLVSAWNNELRDYDYEPPKEPRRKRRRSTN